MSATALLRFATRADRLRIIQARVALKGGYLSGDPVVLRGQNQISLSKRHCPVYLEGKSK